MVEQSSMDRLASSARVLVCVGPGGVGKTSCSAAIALDAAHDGRRVIVLTIDPARRLANALGLPDFGNEERAVPHEAFARAGVPSPKGRMTAMMLDIKSTWDAVVNRYQTDEERREKLLGNRFYQTLSSKLAGSQEYMAMEMLHELASRTRDRPDLIVLDTPPAANAMDFLEAPAKMIDALDNDATRWLLEPFTPGGGGVRKRFLDVGSSFVIRTLGRFTGVEVLEELAEMLSAFQGMFEGFRDRAKAVRAILGDERTSFLIVGAPRHAPIIDAKMFHRRLLEAQIHVGGFILNRATTDPFGGVPPSPEGLLERMVAAYGGRADLVGRLRKLATQASACAAREHQSASALAREFPDTPVILVPELTQDVHDLVGLETLRTHLFAVESQVRASP